MTAQLPPPESPASLVTGPSPLTRADLHRLFPDLDAPPEVESLLAALLQQLAPSQREQLAPAHLARMLETQLGTEQAGWEAPRLRAGRRILRAYAGRSRAKSLEQPPRTSALLSAPERTFALTFAGQGAAY